MSTFRRLSLGNKFLVILIPLGLLYAVIVAYMFFDSSNDIIVTTAAEEQMKTARVVDRMIDNFASKALATARIFAQNNRIPEAYANPDETAGSDYLAEGIRPIIDLITRDRQIDSFKIHYHKPPARSFLRVWRDKRFDDLSGFRPTILEVYNTRAPVKAIEFGVGGFAVRGLSPIVFDGEYLGSVEFLYNVSDILDLLSPDQAQTDMINVITSETARNALSEDQIREFYSERIGSFYLSTPESDWADPQAFMTDELVEQLRDSDETIVRNHGDVFASFIPLFNLNDDKIGYVVSFTNKSETIAAQRQGVLLNVLIFVGLMVLLVVALAVLIHRVIVGPIRRATWMAEQIAQGNLEV